MDDQQQPETIQLTGSLKGHRGWVTSIATSAEDSTKVLSASRDKTIIVWKLKDGQAFLDDDAEAILGTMQRRLVGHHHFVQDLDISSDGHFALSASWDHTLRLWDLNSGHTETQFREHTGDVMSVAFSADNRQVVSGSRDRTIKLWNVIGDAKYTMVDNRSHSKGGKKTSHDDWVTCVRFSPNADEPVIVSCGCDGLVKVWNLQKCELKFNLVGHRHQCNCVTVSPDGSLCASGGKDGWAMLWDLNEGGNLSTLEAGKEVNSLVFSPNRYWLCAATGSDIKIWDLESKQEVGVLGLDSEENRDPSVRSKAVPILCISLAWSADGQTLFAGYTDSLIRVYRLNRGDYAQ